MQAGEDESQGFFSSYIIKVYERLAGGSYLVMKINPRVPGGRPLTAIGYKYNYSKVL